MPAGTERQTTHRDRSGAGGDLSSFDRAINDLQGRIADLRVSLDDLGEEGAPPAGAAPAPAQPVAPPSPPPADPAIQPPAEAFPPPPEPSSPQYVAPPPEPPPPPLQEPYAPVAPPPEVFLDSPAPGLAMPSEGSDVLGSFSRVDVGPFEDLLAMTAFEEQLSALPSMTDVRVRRFSAGRAEIELATTGVVPVAREVMRIAPDARTTLQADGMLTVDLTAERWTGPMELSVAGEEPAAPETAVDEQGDAGA